MENNTNTDKQTSFMSFSRLACAVRQGERLSPYEAYSERETFTERRYMERMDGTKYTQERTVSRWGGEFSTGEWLTVTFNK